MIQQINRLIVSGQLEEAAMLIRDAINGGTDLQGRHINYANVLALSSSWDAIASIMPKDTNCFVTSGWLRSLAYNRPVNSKNEPIPWFTYPAIDFLDSIIKPYWNVFEWGSGNSTLWWAAKTASVVAIEDNADWYNEINAKMPANAAVYNMRNKTEYVNAIQAYNDNSFDVIIIDGSHRNDCAINSVSKLVHSGIIIFDNSDSSEFNESMHFLDDKGFTRIDFWGLIPSYMYKNCTSVFCRDTALLRNLSPPSRHESSVGISCFQAVENEKKPSELDMIIPPEIFGDEFYFIIKKLAAESRIKTVLEIGSSAGGGSTEAFVSGLRDNPCHPRLFCMEVSKPRFAELQQRYASESFVYSYNVSSVPISCFPSEKEVELFYSWIPSALNYFPLERVLGWLRQDIEYIADSGVQQNGIQKIKHEHGISTFGMVLIDGSEFTGMAELEEIYGAEYILLDDINGFKNRNNYQRLKEDPSYTLLQENWAVRNGYAVFKKNICELPIHFFTIVLNGEPFIRYHIDVFRQLPFKWHWHIVEGVADLKHDTAWSVASGGQISDELHDRGLSNDGTSTYLDWLSVNFPENITVYRKPDGAFWDGKLEMVMAPLPNITEECLLWQIDADELWTSDQITNCRATFLQNPSKSAAFFSCNFFVGPRLVTINHNCYGNHTGFEWLRAWRYEPEDVWLTHEPPQLCRRNDLGEWSDVASLNSFTNAETEQAGLVFQHYAYALESQIHFKEIYYGYSGASGRWLSLQTASDFPVMLSDYFPWVSDGAIVNTIQSCGIKPLLALDLAAPNHNGLPSPKQIILIRTDTIGDNVLFLPVLSHLHNKYPTTKIIVCCQDVVAELYEASPFVDSIIPFNHLRAFVDGDYQKQIISRIQNTNADIAINAAFTRQLLNEYFTLASGAREKIAFYGDLCELSEETRNADNQLYSLLIDSPGANKTDVERNRDLLAGLGISAQALKPMIWTTPDDKEFGKQFFVDQNLDPAKTVALFVTGRHPGKQYPHYPEALGELCRKNGYSVIAFGAATDYEVSDNSLNIPGVRGINTCGSLSLRQSAEVIRRCLCAVGADTGLSHIACAVGTPHVVILWGGHFGRFFPYSPLTTIACLPLDCYGCNWKCPYPHWHCIQNIAPGVIEFALSETITRHSDVPRIFCQSASLLEKTEIEPGWKSCEGLFEFGKAQIVTFDGISKENGT